MIWKEIPGWEGFYEASEAGLIRSMPRMIVQGNRWGDPMQCWRQMVVLRQSTNSRGYLSVQLNGGGRRTSGLAVHRLIALTFIGPCPEGMQVCHNNGDQTDNRVENLRYDTPSANVWDARRHGIWSAGTKHYKYRMDINDAVVLRLRAEGWTYERLAREFGIGEATVGRILKGARLKTIPKERPALGRSRPEGGNKFRLMVR